MRILVMFSLVVLLLMSGVIAMPVSAASTNPAVDPAVSWLHSQQQSDGGFLGFSGKSDPSTTTDVVLALSAAGDDLGTVAKGGPSVVDYLRSQAKDYASTTGGAAKLTLAVVAAGQDPRDFGGQNLVRDILSHQDRNGLFDPQIYVHAYAMLALASAGQTVPASAVTALEQHQAEDGGWAFTGETAAGKADSNTTAVAIEALVAGGYRSSPTIPKAMTYLASLKDSNGLYASQPVTGGPLVGDANSTALVVQAMLATGMGPDSANVTSAVSALSKMTNASGAFYYRADSTDDNLLATAQAIPAIESKPLPIWSAHAPGRTLDQAKAAAQPGDAQRCVFFQQTGHNACQGFLAYWQHYGGLDAFGYPLTEEFTFVDPATGRPTTMQYFERARFEWHPGSAPQRFDVQLGRLGSEQLSTP